MHQWGHMRFLAEDSVGDFARVQAPIGNESNDRRIYLMNGRLGLCYDAKTAAGPVARPFREAQLQTRKNSKVIECQSHADRQLAEA